MQAKDAHTRKHTHTEFDANCSRSCLFPSYVHRQARDASRSAAKHRPAQSCGFERRCATILQEKSVFLCLHFVCCCFCKSPIILVLQYAVYMYIYLFISSLASIKNLSPSLTACLCTYLIKAHLNPRTSSLWC